MTTQASATPCSDSIALPQHIAAVVLAAGQGSRMGNIPKCLIQLNQQPMILRQIEALKAAGIKSITVVTGFHHEPIENLITNDPCLNIIRNISPEQGQQSSVRLGLQQVEHETDLILIALADQPLVLLAEIREMIGAYHNRPAQTDIVYPRVGQQRGNPVLMSIAAVRDFLNSSVEIACRKYIDTHPERVYQYLTANTNFITDLDTPEDLKKLAEQTGDLVSFPDHDR